MSAAVYWLLKFAPAAFLKQQKRAFLVVNWLTLFMKYNFAFYSVIDTLVWIITGLASHLSLEAFDRLGVKNCPRCQHRTDYYRSFKMFCPRALESWQPVKRDCSTNSFALPRAWLTGTFLAAFPPSVVQEFVVIKVSRNTFDLFWEPGCVKSAETHQISLPPPV